MFLTSRFLEDILSELNVKQLEWSTTSNIMKMLDDLIEDREKVGFEQGYNEGFKDGFDEGYDQGVASEQG